jgi:hypothetical protein
VLFFNNHFVADMRISTRKALPCFIALIHRSMGIAANYSKESPIGVNNSKDTSAQETNAFLKIVFCFRIRVRRVED